MLQLCSVPDLLLDDMGEEERGADARMLLARSPLAHVSRPQCRSAPGLPLELHLPAHASVACACGYTCDSLKATGAGKPRECHLLPHEPAVANPKAPSHHS